SCVGPNAKKVRTKQNLQDSITSMENELFNVQSTRMNKHKVRDLIDLYTQYAKDFPDDTLAPVYLFKASDISMNIYQPMKTIRILDTIMVKYPDYNKTPTALFLKAFVYEDQVKNYKLARKYYQMFLDKYPDNEFADDARMSLQNLGKTPEELIREFEEKNK
ncbi:MAG: tetratricopeptide repeat protein, partial [Chlorobi bacterium]|nr:tetratricopeptide repeat protein [Chlorobiota bacterium]